MKPGDRSTERPSSTSAASVRGTNWTRWCLPSSWSRIANDEASATKHSTGILLRPTWCINIACRVFGTLGVGTRIEGEPAVDPLHPVGGPAGRLRAQTPLSAGRPGAPTGLGSGPDLRTGYGARCLSTEGSRLRDHQDQAIRIATEHLREC